MLSSPMFPAVSFLLHFFQSIGVHPKQFAKRVRKPALTVFLPVALLLFVSGKSNATELSDLGLYVLPYPQQVTVGGDAFSFNSNLTIVLNKNHSPADAFTARELMQDIKAQWNIQAEISNQKGPLSIVLLRKKIKTNHPQQSYQITVGKNEITIIGNDEAGLFYGTRTLLQLILKKGDLYQVPGMRITDWPSILQRAAHYDTKHHQDKMSYVKSFIKELADFKINMLVWEWEDKFAYPSHPEIGAPGAFTPAELREVTAFAKKYHIQLVPLVQGLGHVSFILKWPQHAHLREIPASNFEFCPLKDSTYVLLFDLWKDAMDATPGSQYIHIGSDETYELGECEQCRKKVAEIGLKGLYHLFTEKAAKFILSQKRKPMVWETPMGWEVNNDGKSVLPHKGLVLTEDDTQRDKMIDNARSAKQLGYEVFFYDPNPGTEPLFLPYFYKIVEGGERKIGALEDSYTALKSAATSGVYDGMIRTSWDDAGLHNQMWMMCFVTAAAYSWNGALPGLQDFKTSFFKNYYGQSSADMEELYELLNGGAYYYWESFERKVWHWGEIGKTFLPDLPRGDAVEYDPFWNTQYSDKLRQSEVELEKMNRALNIIRRNRATDVKHAYDFEVFESIVQLIRHTCMAYMDMAKVENAVRSAHQFTFVNRDTTFHYLQQAATLMENCIKQRNEVFNQLVETWDKTRLPKGMATGNKKYFFEQDRTRHFANRKPDMTYLIYDEQKLGMEQWLTSLKQYMEEYRNNAFRQ